MDLIAQLTEVGIVPVVVIDDAAQAPDLAGALVAGGLPMIEVTLRTPAALAALTAMAGQTGAIVGAGTVTTPDQVSQVFDAGARFVVSPGLDAEVVARAEGLGLPVLPGIATASELMAAAQLGLDAVKFFPAAVLGGPPAIRALAAPFPTMRFVPTGGIDARSAGDYLALDAVIAVGGSWMVDRGALASGDLAAIEAAAGTARTGLSRQAA